jgi:hypothetical protein
MPAGEPIPASFTGAWGHTAITSLWVPVVVFAHVFAAFWLAKTWMLNSPALNRGKRSGSKTASKVVKVTPDKVQAALKTSGGAAPGAPRVKGAKAVAVAPAAAPHVVGAEQVAIQVGGALGLEARAQVGGAPRQPMPQVLWVPSRCPSRQEVRGARARAPCALARCSPTFPGPQHREVSGPAASCSSGRGLPAGAVPPLAPTWAAPPPPAQVGGLDASPFAQGAPASEPCSSDPEPEETPEAVFEALEASRTLAHTLSVNVAPSTLEWQGIGCSYNTPTGVKDVLADVWGIAQPGEMQALLGPSGAGKSTFMVHRGGGVGCLGVSGVWGWGSMALQAPSFVWWPERRPVVAKWAPSQPFTHAQFCNTAPVALL